jgi:hypothetical protein
MFVACLDDELVDHRTIPILIDCVCDIEYDFTPSSHADDVAGRRLSFCFTNM